jgi:membrane fusion protein (multidrug efflux system)
VSQIPRHGRIFTASLTGRDHFQPRRVAWGSMALAALLSTAGCNGAASGRSGEAAPDATAVNAMQVQLFELRREVEAVGTLAARDETVVSSEVEARVARLAADMGDRVTAGDPLVILDAEKLRYRVDEQRASLEQTRARLGARGTELPKAEDTPDVMSAAARHTEAEQQLARARQLSTRQLVSKEDLERAETQLETARAAHEAALASARNLRAEVTAREAALNGANRDLQDATIRAPFDGVVAERLVSQGQFVSVQTPVMRLVRLHPLRLTAEIPERFGPAIRVGHTVSIRVDALPDTAVEGRVTRISPSVNMKSRAFAIEGEVPNADGTLKPGTFARVRIVTDRVDKTLAVPVTAVQTRYGRSVVFIIRDGKLTAAEVKLGDRLGPRVEVLSGVEPGTTIVSDGVEGLTDGQAVVPRNTAAKPPTEGAGR